jgi:acetyl-CoA carboxylase biotin carboxyl carrier protein
MTLEEIKELIALANEHGLAEIEFERDGERVRIRRAAVEHEVILPQTTPMQAGQPQQQAAPPAATGFLPQPPPPPSQRGTSRAPVAQPAVAAEALVYVKAPIVGTYYESPSPGAAPFISVGDRVAKGQVLCIIESMKLMNEIESEVTGIVVQKIAANATPVGYGEPLLAVRSE